MDTNNPQNYSLGKGKVYIARLDEDGGMTGGEIYMGNTPTFDMTGTSEGIKHYSSAEKAAPMDASDTTKTELGLKIVGDEFTKENVALMLFGDVATLSQTTAAITAEEFASVMQGRFYALLYRDVTDVVVTGPAGTPVYVLDEDYTVDAVRGRIGIVVGGGIADEEDLEVDYTYGTIALPTVRGITVPAIKCFVRFVGDPVRGPKWECQIWRASIKADGALNFISNEYATFNLTGDIEADPVNHPTEPHFRLIDLTAVEA